MSSSKNLKSTIDNLLTEANVKFVNENSPLYQQCITYGILNRNASLFLEEGLNVCGNPGCDSCQDFTKGLDQCMKDCMDNMNE